MTDKEAIERLKRIDIRFFLSGMNEQSNYIVDEADKVNKAIETVLNLIQTQQTEIEKKDNKLKDIENHIKAELRMIDKCFNEVGWAGKEQYDGMRAAYKCLLNIYFENQAKM